MAALKINTLDDYEMYLGERLEGWSPEQRLALAAAMADRWLPAYDTFSKREDWGDPSALQRCLDAVWAHLLKNPELNTAARSKYVHQIHEVTPHMDDFDAIEALVACTILSDAVECCRMGNNIRYVIRAVLSGYEGLVEDWSLDIEEQPHLWQSGPVRKELRKQLKLVEKIGGLTDFSDASVKTLRSGLTQPDMIGEALARETTHEILLISNQAAFEQYRRMIEMDNRGKDPAGLDLQTDVIYYHVMLFAEWASRYRRRLDTISGNFGKLADTQGLEALVNLQRARDAQELEIPVWDPEMRAMFDMAIQNGMNGLDIRSLGEPHGYGPSLRRLWSEAKRRGASDADACLAIIAWARHLPDAWREADERRKKGHIENAVLGECMCRKVTWVRTENLDIPWETCVEGQSWQARINDFPDDYLYSLFIAGKMAGKFHDWPETWIRE